MGMHDNFSREKFDREYREWFAGIEASNFGDLEDMRNLFKFARERQMNVGVHHPLLKQGYSGVIGHPFYGSRDEAVRQRAFLALREALAQAAELGAWYVLIHYPKPSLLRPELDWSDWRFPKAGESLQAEDHLLATEREIGLEFFAKLSGLQREFGVPLVVEHDILHPIHYNGLFKELFLENPSLGLCVDTGRFHMLESTDRGLTG